MTTYSLPLTPNNTTVTFDGNSIVHQSWLTGFTQAVSFGGERISINLFYQNLTSSQRNQMMGFIAKLNGQQHRVLLPIHGHEQRGNFGGTPLVAGASQKGNSLDIDGASTGITNWIREGDVFSVAQQLKIATADANSDGSGNVTLTFRPRLRSSPSNNAAIDVTDPEGLFVLADSSVQWSMRPGGFSDLSMQFVEAI